MKKINTLSVVVFSILLSACGSQQLPATNATKGHAPATKNKSTALPMLAKVSWILGSWRGIPGNGVSVEAWSQQDDSTFLGAGMFIKGTVTMSQESILLVQRGTDLLYIPTVKNQNNGQPVTFKMTALTDNKVVFENRQHDFPQLISYTLVADDSLVAVISGDDKGMHRTESFSMTKKKP